MNKQDIFKNYTLKTDSVDVPNWGGAVNIQELSAGALEAMKKADGSELTMATIVVMHGVTDDNGKRMFNEADKAKLMGMSATDLVLVSTAVIELSDLGVDSEGK
jgi:hypothetical protein